MNPSILLAGLGVVNHIHQNHDGLHQPIDVVPPELLLVRPLVPVPLQLVERRLEPRIAESGLYHYLVELHISIVLVGHQIGVDRVAEAHAGSVVTLEDLHAVGDVEEEVEVLLGVPVAHQVLSSLC